MKEKIKQSLTNKYKHLGLSTETIEGVANQLAVFVKEESAIEPAVNGAEEMLKSIQRFADSRVTAFKNEAERNKTEIEQLKAKLAELEGKGEPNPPANTEDAIKVMMESFTKQIETLSSSIASLSNERKHETLSQKFKALIGSDVPESYYSIPLSGRQFKDENEVSEFVQAIKTGYETFKQELANQGFEQTKKPETGNAKSYSDSECLDG